MTREEILKDAKPILFNTDMVRAILDGRKTVTRRGIKEKKYYTWPPVNYDTPEDFLKDKGYLLKPSCDKADAELLKGCLRPPYQPGCILYVRETWTRFCCCSCEEDYSGKCVKSPNQKDGCFMYRANDEIWGDAKWRPSIHMPKEVARIFLRVTDVRVERLQEITEEQAKKEGAVDNRSFIHSPDNEYDNIHSAKEHFKQIWNSTIKKSDLDRYGWDANPWVWVIEFERVMEDENVN